MSDIKLIHNVTTGEIKTVELTQAEKEQIIKDAQEFVARQSAIETEAQAKATQKAALLERLGISEDEARLLLA
jgi:hypothetical protein